MLTYNAVPWLMKQDSLSAVRARRLLSLNHEGDMATVREFESACAGTQSPDGSFEQSPMKTAGVLNLLDDLKATDSEELIANGISYLISVLESQPDYERAKNVKPGSLQTPCDLCDFFGPYEERSLPEVMAQGAREMNFYREYEPLLGPKSPVRGVRRSNLDRAGPASCYSWGLIPLSYIIETLCHAGYAHNKRLRPAINVLLGAQRESGGWCRNLGGHPNCTIHGIRVLGTHPDLRQSEYAERALRFMQMQWKRPNIFALIQAIAKFDLPTAQEIIRNALEVLAPRQRKNGTFGNPNRIERVTAVLIAARVIG